MIVKIKNKTRKKINISKLKEIAEYVLKEEIKSPGRVFKRFLKKISPDKIKLNLYLVSEKEIVDLNKKFFNSDELTDVISFSLIEGEEIIGDGLLGEGFICVDVAEENAKEYGNTFEEELGLLVIHSVLHILGYEHKSKNSKMRRLERKYFKNVFQR